MPNFESALERESAPRKGRKYFTLAEARRALPLVKRIAADIQLTQGERLRLLAELSSGVAEVSPEQARRLQTELERYTESLDRFVDELEKVGVELKDAGRALLDFPAIHEGREVLLCWQGGETGITHWHEIDTGFAGRRPVEELHEPS